LPPAEVVVIFFLFSTVSGNYRHFHIENTDICNDRKTGTLEIGTGAVILQLDNPLKIQHEYDNKGRGCEINLKAPPHFGIMVGGYSPTSLFSPLILITLFSCSLRSDTNCEKCHFRPCKTTEYCNKFHSTFNETYSKINNSESFKFRTHFDLVPFHFMKYRKKWLDSNITVT